ncbi:MAG: hypothetical protein ACK4PR_05615 [Gammaproteobacteria bacterium]
MNKLQTSSTSSSITRLIMISSLLTPPALVPSSNLKNHNYILPNIKTQNYQREATTSTYQSYVYVEDSSANTFEKTMTEFYTFLTENQKPLGDKFEKILYENLWDLYQS